MQQGSRLTSDKLKRLYELGWTNIGRSKAQRSPYDEDIDTARVGTEVRDDRVLPADVKLKRTGVLVNLRDWD